MAVKRSVPDLAQRLRRKRRRNWIVWAAIAFLVAIALRLLFNVAHVRIQNAARPIDAILVLGGSIHREIYAAELSTRYPTLPILISHGSDDPCIYKTFQLLQARMTNIWLEKCANSTFDNFLFSVPILKSWGVHHVKVITSSSHLPRAEWLARIHLAAQGIAVEIDIAGEWGKPGNHESRIKTMLDVTRSLLWVGVAQVVSPPCFDIIELSKVNIRDWETKPYRCEYSPKLQRSRPGVFRGN